MKHGLKLSFGCVIYCGFVINACFLEALTVDSGPVEQTEAEDDHAHKKLEFDSVRRIHYHLDDDKNGDVDFKESKEFLQHELHVQDSKRHSKFHSGDESITVEDLWKAWQKNDVSKWTTDQVVDWLKAVVHLPQYAEIFAKKKMNGHQIPRLAAADDSILIDELGISNVIDRKKIALRAMDVVLFGAPKDHNYLKDVLLGVAVLVAMASFWFSNIQKRKAQKQMVVMMKDIEYLQDAEKDLTSLQDRLQQAESSRQVIQQEKHQLESNLKKEIETAKREAHRLRTAREDQSEEIHTRLKLAEEELVQVREALRKAEKEVEYLSSSDVSSSLEKWLQITYQKEVKHFIQRRAAAFRKMDVAKDACDKINRKRNSLFGSLRLVHDQNIDEVDQKILAARSSLAEVTNELEELQHRWHQIGACCRLNLCVDSSVICDATDQCGSSALGQALAMCGKVGTLGSIKNDAANNSLPKVSTYPSLQLLADGTLPTRSTSYSNLGRQISAPPTVDAKISKDESVLEGRHEPDGSPLLLNSPDIITQTDSRPHKNGLRIHHDVEYENQNNEIKTVLLESDNETRNSSGSLKMTRHSEGNGHDGIKGRKKSSISPDAKSFLPKKKWWSRNKRHHNAETELETDIIENNAGSLSKEELYQNEQPTITLKS